VVITRTTMMIGVVVVGQGGGTMTAISGSQVAVIGVRDCDGRGDDIVCGSWSNKDGENNRIVRMNIGIVI